MGADAFSKQPVQIYGLYSIEDKRHFLSMFDLAA